MNIYQAHEFVDLGLPSGTLWATCNIGANKPEDYGEFFLWVDGKTAATKWGNGWQMPSKEQWEELMSYTENSWTTRNGENGRLFKASNGNCLFLPAAGYRWDGELNDAGSYGYYWSSSLGTDNPFDAWNFYFDSGYCLMNLNLRRFNGLSVRAVRES